MAEHFHLETVARSGGRRLCLYSARPRHYEIFEGLPAVDSSSAHMRRHPLTGEWIGHASARQGRTFLPNAADCPFCCMTADSDITDIPVDDYEIAIFSNRFSALSPSPDMPPELGVETAPGLGICEVISYSADHAASLSTIGVDRLTLLVAAIGAQATDLLANDAIHYVLPFENRGREIGVTIDHPHGQIYALSHVPTIVARAADSFKSANPLADLATSVPDNLVLCKNDVGMAFAPEWARYPFEVWVAPYRRAASPDDLSPAEQAGFATLLDEAAKKLDAVAEGVMPLTMSWQIAPKGHEDHFHFHCQFQPLKRSKTKQKFLASVEQFTGFFLVDLPPEQAARILNGESEADE